jgi:uncharacterized protein YbjT (DUF2867 family)
MEKKTIVVCASTGNQGKAVVEALLTRRLWRVIALSRDPESERARFLTQLGVEVRKGDIEDKASLLKTFTDAYGVFGVTQPWSADYKTCNIEKELLQGQNIADACKVNGIQHLVLSTVLNFGASHTGVPHVDSKLRIEEYVIDKGIPYTFLRPASFMDNIGMNFFPIKNGSIRGFVAADAKVPYIACADIGAFAAIALENPERYLGKGINLISDFVSGNDLCSILSRIRNGERFRYQAPPAFLLRLFAREFYLMRSYFEKNGRPPYPKEVDEVIAECKKSHPGLLTMEHFLKRQGFDKKTLR